MGTEVLSGREVIGRFYKSLEQGAHPWADRLSWTNSGANQGKDSVEKYAWLGQAPTPREWRGPRQPRQLRQDAYEIRNKPWESSIGIPLDHWKKDKTGQIMARVNDLARRYGAHKAKLMSTLMLNGATALCYDGQYFFDTDHAEGDSGTQSNKLSVDISALPTTNHGSTTAPSAGEFAQSIMQGVAAMYGFKDDVGEPMNEMATEFHVIVPISLWMVAKTAVGGKVLASGEDNPLAIGSMDGFSINVHANARLTWTDTFAVFRGDGDVKPFIFQEDGGVNSKILGPDSEYATLNDEVLITTDAVNNAGYGYWQHACQVIMT